MIHMRKVVTYIWVATADTSSAGSLVPCHVSLLVAKETSSFLFEVILILFSVCTVDSGEYWEVDVHWVVWAWIFVVVWASVSIAVVVTSIVISKILLFNLSWGSSFITLVACSHHRVKLCLLHKLGLGGKYPFVKRGGGLISFKYGG